MIDTLTSGKQYYIITKCKRCTLKTTGSFDAAPPAVGLPEVAFVGRSNVGKSSMLNSLTNSKIAVTSKTPGRYPTCHSCAHTDNYSQYYTDNPHLNPKFTPQFTRRTIPQAGITHSFRSKLGIKLVVASVPSSCDTLRTQTHPQDAHTLYA